MHREVPVAPGVFRLANPNLSHRLPPGRGYHVRIGECHVTMPESARLAFGAPARVVAHHEKCAERIAGQMRSKPRHALACRSVEDRGDFGITRRIRRALAP